MNNAGAAILGILYVGIIVMLIAAEWRVFTKAGEAGWKVLIPIWNFIVLLRIIGRPWWWILLLLIPFLNLLIFLVMGIIICIDLAKSFGKGGGFAAGLFLLTIVFVPILGFGDATYRGPAGAGGVS